MRLDELDTGARLLQTAGVTAETIALPFRDRREAGMQLAARLRTRPTTNGVVIALPRGGVPVGAEVARALGLPLDVLVVRKLGLPDQPELAIGAIASGGVRVFNDELLRLARPDPDEVEAVIRTEEAELERRERAYRHGHPHVPLQDRDVILVDDGLATGASMRAAVLAARQLGARRVLVAVPVGSADTCATLENVADEVVCLATPEPFSAVGLWYRDFSQTTDEEVQGHLSQR